MKASRFADYRAIFRRSLELVNRSGNVSAALSGALRELYPLTHRDIEPSLREMFESTKLSHNWGDLRALRALADDAELAKVPGGADHPGSSDPAGPPRLPGFDDSVADLEEVFRAAHKKASSGFQPSDALEMACKELYPYTSRKVLRAAEQQLRSAMQENRISLKGALRLLAGGRGA